MNRLILPSIAMVIILAGAISVPAAGPVYGNPLLLAHSAHHKKDNADVKPEPGKKAGENVEEVCPVSGEAITDANRLTYEYQGKVYSFCCQGCLDEFKKNPEAYIKKGAGDQPQGGHKH